MFTFLYNVLKWYTDSTNKNDLVETDGDRFVFGPFILITGHY